jgi:hypothetical protein
MVRPSARGQGVHAVRARKHGVGRRSPSSGRDLQVRQHRSRIPSRPAEGWPAVSHMISTTFCVSATYIATPRSLGRRHRRPDPAGTHGRRPPSGEAPLLDGLRLSDARRSTSSLARTPPCDHGATSTPLRWQAAGGFADLESSGVLGRAVAVVPTTDGSSAAASCRVRGTFATRTRRSRGVHDGLAATAEREQDRRQYPPYDRPRIH